MRLQLLRSKDPLVKRVSVAYWAMLGVTILLETIFVAVRHDPVTMPKLLGCLVLLAILSALSIHWPEQQLPRRRLVFALAELFLLTVAAVLGTYRFIWPLYLVLIARAALIVDKKDLWLVVSMSCLSQAVWYFLKALISVPLQSWTTMVVTGVISSFMMTTSSCVLVVVVAWLMRSLVNEQRLRTETERLSRENELMAAELERTRIAREIHDTLGHSLTSLKIQLELAGRLLDSGDAQARDVVSQAEDLAVRSLTDTRVALQSIRNNDFNFEQAVDELTRNMRASGAVTLHVNIQPPVMSNAISYQLYRVIQECLTNTLKHAQATDVFVTLHGAAEAVELEVRDNGKGFDPSAAVDGFGLRGLKERIASLKGSVNVNSKTEEGTQVSVKVPLS
jgi:signal transduction histidine kinase